MHRHEQPDEQPIFTNVSVQAQDMYLRLLLSGISGIAGIITMPIEMCLRPQFGTMYFHPITAVLGWLVIQIASLVGVLGPGTQRDHSSAPIGMGITYLLLYAIVLAHLPRLWRRAVHMELEEDAEDEGPALPIFNLLPHHTWALTRIVYEPLTIALAGALLYMVGIVTPFVSLYLAVVAVALVLKNTIRQYDWWRILRDLLNGQARARVLQHVAKGDVTPTNASSFILGVAAKQPPAIRERVGKALAARMSPETSLFLSPPEPPQPPPNSVM